ncbi:MAG TPA: radical SAM family heme chaperone HemW [Phycisphaerae bacterium]|nr:radical SAM family heme chaperone HemW [Phycisphaerae bacterium]HNU45494.1 radical SAM family heme chaperone HemW [Phycisphaerae bacterium]
MASPIDMTAGATRSREQSAGCGLYVHVPYCRRKCGYCDFYSVPVHDRPVERLVAAISAELDRRLAECVLPVHTIYIGGGTPTILPVEALGSLLHALRPVVATHRPVEFTVEANPGTVDERRAAVLVDAGVTRVSLGAQSFIPAELATLDREHAPADLTRSVATLRAAGIRQINLDLIFGIPDQTPASWSASLKQVLDAGVEHLACYGLTYEPGTPLTERLARGEVTRCPESLEADMYEQAMDFLPAHGFDQYEISNFARPGSQCRHNLLYWHNEPYLGVGPSAAGCVGRRRYRNVEDVDEYLTSLEAGRLAEEEVELLDDEMLMHELLLMQLRLTEGLAVEVFRQRTGMDPLQLLQEPLGRLTTLGLLTVGTTHVALTRAGRLLADRVILELVRACPPGVRH